jgi:hypothetical protein
MIPYFGLVRAKVSIYLNSLLTRYSGIATAICGAALGFNAASGKTGEQ